MAKLIKVLSIDGGGIRGIIPAMILAEIERRSKKPIAGHFDLIAGTSSGGILALGLTVPGDDGQPRYSAEDGIQLFSGGGGRIFSRSLWHKIHSVWNVEQEKYRSDGIEEVFRAYFGDTRLKDALTELLITSYEIERRTPFFFKTTKAKDPDQPGYDFPMWQVARATSAAPTYFEPVKIEIDDPSGYYALVDGGIFANNPAMCALAEASAMHPESEFLIASLGAGEFTQPLLYDHAKNWGLRRWAQPIVGISFDGTSATVDYQLTQLLPGSRYFRFQGKLNECNDDMDDADPANVRALQLLAAEIIATHDEALDRLCGQLV